MADLAKIRVGDTLKIPVEVTHADDAMGAPVRVVGDFMRTVVDGKEEIWISRQLVEAAEHIPAPKVFKRGDWVRHLSAQYRGISYKGVVVADGLGILTVSWNHDPMTLLAVAAADLEPDEAPE